MKRSLCATFSIGIIAAVIVIVLQKSGLLRWPEEIIARMIFRGSPNDDIGAGNYLLVAGLGFGGAWAMLAVAELPRRCGLLLLLIVELIAAAWVLAIAGVFFQPLPGILVAAVAAALAAGFSATNAGRQRRATETLFQGRLSQTAIDRLAESDAADLSEAKTHEVSFVFCEIANQADLLEELPPAACTRLTREFVDCAADLFLRENGYIHAADGEGIRVVFGFPNANENHAADAARTVLAFRERFAAEASRKPESLGKIDLRIGISSGEILATVRKDSRGREIVIAGEPLALARRLALANHIYGSRILLGPRTFSGAGKEIVARPIDLLRNTDVHNRVEVYELLALAAKASPEELARRDRFWTGIVYFRERRWNEAFAEFSHARRENGEQDEPLQWYLRRLEPLLLRMTTEPAPVVEPLSPL